MAGDLIFFVLIFLLSIKIIDKGQTMPTRSKIGKAKENFLF